MAARPGPSAAPTYSATDAASPPPGYSWRTPCQTHGNAVLLLVPDWVREPRRTHQSAPLRGDLAASGPSRLRLALSDEQGKTPMPGPRHVTGWRHGEDFVLRYDAPAEGEFVHRLLSVKRAKQARLHGPWAHNEIGLLNDGPWAEYVQAFRGDVAHRTDRSQTPLGRCG